MDQAPQDQELRNIIDKVYFKLLSNGEVGVSEVLKVITGVSKYWNSICAENDLYLAHVIEKPNLRIPNP
jgi:hypothetical protein